MSDLDFTHKKNIKDQESDTETESEEVEIIEDVEVADTYNSQTNAETRKRHAIMKMKEIEQDKLLQKELDLYNNYININQINKNLLYIGNYNILKRKDLLEELKIQTIISVSKRQPPRKFDQIYYYEYNEFNINNLNYNAFILILKIITKSMNKGRPILIQCEDGLSNSCIILLFYLSTLNNGLSIKQKYDWLCKKIPNIKISENIMTSIINFGNMYNDEQIFSNYCKKILNNI